MPGYRLAEADKQRLSHFLCCICALVMRNPVQTILCGHRFCKSCFDALVSATGRAICPVDQLEVKSSEVFPDKFIEREIMSTVVSCLQRSEGASRVDGCSWRGKIQELEDHLNTCVFSRVKCVNPGCDQHLRRSSLAQHLSEDCPHRIIICKDCKRSYKFMLEKEHRENDCPRAMIYCNLCGEMLERIQLEEHRDPDFGSCTEVEGACPFARIGCMVSQNMKKSDREHHQQSYQVVHLNYLLRQMLKIEHHVSRLANELSVINVKSLTARIEKDVLKPLETVSSQVKKLEEHVTSNENQIKHAMEKLNAGCSNSKRVDQLEETVNMIMTQVSNALSEMKEPKETVASPSPRPKGSRRQAEEHDPYSDRRLATALEKIRQLENRVDAQDHMLTIKNIGMADMEQRLNDAQAGGNNGSLIWKIDHVAQKRQEARTGKRTSFYSVPFYTSRYGYKLCCRIYLQGDGLGKGTHLSLFLVIMRGEYDGILPWPFRQRVTMTIIDQEHRQNVSDYFLPDPSSSSFQRPTNETNIASGCPMFCPLAELDRFIRDDTLFLKVNVCKANLEEFE